MIRLTGLSKTFRLHGRSKVVANMTLAYNPIVLRSADGWHAVSLDGSDAVAGYVEAKYLTDSSEMPAYQ